MAKYLYAGIYLLIIFSAFFIAMTIGLTAIDGLFDPLLAFVTIIALIVFSDEATKRIEKKWSI